MNCSKKSRSLLARGIPFLLAGASLLAGGEAAATVAVTSVNVIDGDAGAGPTRPTAAHYWISYEDCIQDTILQFTVASDAAVSVAASVSLDCSDGTLTTTTTGTTPDQLCYSIGNNFPNGSIVSVSAHDLVKGTLGVDCRVSTAIPTGASFTWPAPISFYFYVPVADAASTDFTVWPGGAGQTGPVTEEITLVGPLPPAPVSLVSGDEGLVLHLPLTPTDSNTLGYYAFCYPEADAGTGDAGTGDAGASECPAGTTLPEVPSLASKFLCGSQIAATTTQYPITSVNGQPLVNGTAYTVAIAAYDEVFNLGPVAALQCGTPEAAPGLGGDVGGGSPATPEGGPGGCAVSTGGTAPWWPVMGVGALAAVGILVRRGRRRRGRAASPR